jgi:hypothetical protein
MTTSRRRDRFADPVVFIAEGEGTVAVHEVRRPYRDGRERIEAVARSGPAMRVTRCLRSARIATLAFGLAMLLGEGVRPPIAWGEDELFVANFGANSITVYGRTANGDVGPTGTLAGPATGLNGPIGVVVDTVNDELVVTNLNDNSVTVYGRAASGNTVPTRRIAGGTTGLNLPYGVAVDPVHDELAVANLHSITVYSRTASGNTAPIRTLAGATTALSSPAGLVLDPVHDELVVTNASAVTVYGRTASGDTPPSRTLAGESTGLNGPFGVVVDVLHDELVVANFDSVTVYGRTASGDTAPIRTLTGDTTGLEGASGLVVDTLNNELAVANFNLNSVTVYGRTASGDTAPTRTLAGAATGLSGPSFLAVTVDLASVAPVLSVTPASLNFGSVIVNTTMEMTFTVRNIGGGTLTGTAAASGAPFSVVAGSPFMLGAGASQTVTVRFSPTAGNTFTSNVNFTSDAGTPSRSVTGQGQTFSDVPANHPFWTWIEALLAAGITGGCATSPPQYCPDDAVTRAQMAVFLLRAVHGAGYQPPAATGTMFPDVPASQPLAKWIEQLAREGITGGCSTSPPQYCPDDAVTRAQMAVFLLRARHGAGYQPPAATGTLFPDVPASQPLAKWIEQLAREGITGGCGGGNYCPDDPVTRGQMAVFLVRAFNLPM